MTLYEFVLLAFACVGVATLIWIAVCAIADIHDRLRSARDRNALTLETGREALFAVTFLIVTGSLFALWCYLAAIHKGVLS